MKKQIDPEKVAQIAAMRARGFLTVSEASHACKVPRATVYGWLRAGLLPSQRVGLRKVYVLRDALMRLAGVAP